MIHKITVSILILVSLIGCSNSAYVAPSISKIQASENAKKYPALQGVHVWVQVKNHVTRHKYCDALASKGMIVTCENSTTMTSMVEHNEIALTCPRIKKKVAPLIISLLKMPNTKVLDLRSKAGYNKGESCEKYSALFLHITESGL